MHMQIHKHTTVSPPEKKLGTKIIDYNWKRKKCSTRSRQSSKHALGGHQQHTSRMVGPGICFLKRLFELIAIAQRADHQLRLKREVRADLEWCYLLDHGNGSSLLVNWQSKHLDIELFSNASESWSYGAHWGRKWLQHSWAGELNRD